MPIRRPTRLEQKKSSIPKPLSPLKSDTGHLLSNRTISMNPQTRNPKNTVISRLISLREEAQAEKKAVRAGYISDLIRMVSTSLSNTEADLA
jgi:hypothetical protein